MFQTYCQDRQTDRQTSYSAGRVKRGNKHWRFLLWRKATVASAQGWVQKTKRHLSRRQTTCKLRGRHLYPGSFVEYTGHLVLAPVGGALKIISNISQRKIKISRKCFKRLKYPEFLWECMYVCIFFNMVYCLFHYSCNTTSFTFLDYHL
jgi:hypothetical protein